MTGYIENTKNAGRVNKMLDKSLELCYLIMYRENAENYPQYVLPKGYSFYMYQKGDEVKWAEIEISVGQFKSVEESIACFNIQFGNDSLKKEERILFVKNEEGKCVATGAMWSGNFNGKTVERMHWIAVDESCKGKGIAKAIVSELLNIYNRLNSEGLIYLITESWCYSAINIYLQFGFKPYFGNNPVDELGLSDAKFIEQNERGWTMVNKKIADYNKKI